MRVLIVEDETSSYENLLSILSEVAPDTEVVGNTESVAGTVSWLNNHDKLDLIFMDIHLSDDSAFTIFNQIEVTVPIVFTTAYDHYAVQAFRFNSIDYLLKPISAYLGRMASLLPESRWQSRLLVPYRDMLVPVSVADISFIYSTEKNTTICLNSGEQYAYNKSLDAILSILNPHQFFRANKQFVVNRESVRKIAVWYDSRLLVTLSTTTPERLFVSKNRAAEFKQWMTGVG